MPPTISPRAPQVPKPVKDQQAKPSTLTNTTSGKSPPSKPAKHQQCKPYPYGH